jgi:hypothetical protein
LLSTLVRLTPDGYRPSDARFLMGAIHWRRGDVAEAVRVWRQMTIVADDEYVGSCSRILDVLGHDADASRLRADEMNRINAILDAEHRKWVDVSFDRCRGSATGSTGSDRTQPLRRDQLARARWQAGGSRRW